MNFILNEAEGNTPNLQVSDYETEENNDDSKFIDDTSMEQESISFYRELTNLDHYPKFEGQTRDPIEVTYSDVDDYFGEDNQPELYCPEETESVKFDRFDKFEQSIEKFKKILLKFDDIENHLFYAVIYGLMYKRTDNKNSIRKEDAQKILGDELYFDLLQIESSTLLDKSLFGFFGRCFSINQVIAKYGYFLRFFERRNLYRYLLKKKAIGRNELARDLLACILRKSNGYDILRKGLERKEKKHFEPIHIIYELSFGLNVSVLCYFCPQIQLSYRCYIGFTKEGAEKIIIRTVRQCHYCCNYFAKAEQKMKEHISVCSAKEGIIYSFDNSQIIDYQDNYKYMGDLPFSIYFDFETTTGDAVFFD